MSELKRLQIWVLDELADLQRPQILEKDELLVTQGMESAYELVMTKIEEMLKEPKGWD